MGEVLFRMSQIGNAPEIAKMRRNASPHVHPLTILHARKSWSKSFSKRARDRRFIAFYDDQPHVQQSWAHAFRMPWLAPKLTSHAPWLNGEAIAYRRTMHPNVEFFI